MPSRLPLRRGLPTLRRAAASLLGPPIVVLAMGAAACDEDALDKPEDAAAAAATSGPVALDPKLRGKVLAKVGDRAITLGEYAATLDRMDKFERLRYQSEERRKVLLDEIIKAELLANEARRRGLDDDPATRQRIRQILRDQLLRDLRAELPPPAKIPDSEVKKYYEKHRDDFREPERRRVAHLVVKGRASAEKILEEAKEATPMQWGKLVQKHSLDEPPAPSPTAPLELAGDLGLVGPPGDERGANPKVPEPLRKAIFDVEKVGGVLDRVVEADGKFHILRMTGKTAARDRSLDEAERNIRVSILQERIRDAEKKLEADLRKKYSVTVDDAALAKIEIPEVKSSRSTKSGSKGGKSGSGSKPAPKSEPEGKGAPEATDP